MTQLTVSLEDISPSVLRDVKKAISMLRGVTSVHVTREKKEFPNKRTLKAIHEAEVGDTIKCNSMDEYLELVNHDIQD